MVMGKKKPNKAAADGGARCGRHRRQGAVSGVCPLCLRERLSRLSLSTSLPSVVAARHEAAAAAAASCSDSEASSSTEASSGASSGSGASPRFHREMRRAARPTLLMRHERVVAVDGDGVVLRMRRKERPASFWTKQIGRASCRERVFRAV